MSTQTISFAPRAIPVPAQSEKWSVDAVLALLELPLPELIFRAQLVHREHFSATEIQLSTLLSIKTGGCTENCSYCSQSMHNEKAMANSQARSGLLDTDSVRASAITARVAGATRFCMGAAWRQIRDGDLAHLTAMIRTVRDLGMETCLTAGMLKPHQAAVLQEAGLDYYNHNLDTSPEIYGDIVSTRTYQDRLDTLAIVHRAGLKTCSGGIVGLGENRRQRAGLIAQLANLDPYPHSVPINQLVRVDGTPLQDVEPLDPLEVVRAIAATRVSMPKAWVRLSAGRQALGDLGQTLCFLAGANAIFYGDRLLTTDNPDFSEDQDLFERLGLHATRLTA